MHAINYYSAPITKKYSNNMKKNGEGTKWKTVGGNSKKGGTRGNSTSKSNSNNHIATSGLKHSSAPFSQYSERIEEGEEEGENGDPYISTASSIKGETSIEHAQSVQNHSATVHVKKRSSSKKTKPKKSFEECLEELLPTALDDAMEEIQTKHEGNYLNILKDTHGYLQSAFSQAEPEKEHTFFSKPPGYPLCALSRECQEPLRCVLVESPSLTLENMFRYCLNRFIGELSAGTNTYGTRIMLLLMINCNTSVCSEANKIIQLMLQSNITKVPEALSLLWVGLPHPNLHPLTAVTTWPDLCLPLFQQTNIPKQVFGHAVEYTQLLISTINGDLLMEALTPQVVVLLLTSPPLLNKRSQKNVRDFLDMIQDAVLETASDKKIGKFFKASFLELSSEEDLNPLLLAFATRCLEDSGSSWEVWSRVCSSSIPSTLLLFKELSTREKGNPPLPFERLAEEMTKISTKIPSKDRVLVKELLAAYALDEPGIPAEAVDEREGRWCSVCGVMVLGFSLFYICCLVYLLYYIADKGPDAILSEISTYIGPREINRVWNNIASLLGQFFELIQHYGSVIFKE